MTEPSASCAPTSNVTASDMASHPLAEARRYLVLGEPHKARLILELVLSQHPDYGPALLVMSYVRVELGDLAAAERDARLALAHPELRAEAASALAQIIATRDLDEAVTWAVEAVNLEPSRSEHRLVLARVLRERGALAEAREQADAGLMTAVSPEERLQALITAGSIAVRDPGRYGEALLVAQDAVRIDPTDAVATQLLATAQMVAGRRAEAAATALRVLRENPLARLPPYLAQLSVAMLLRRLLGCVAVVAVLTAGFGLGSLSEPYLGQIGPRVAAAIGAFAIGVLTAVVLGPLRDRATARAVWLFARRRRIEVVSAATVVVIFLGYIVTAVTGLLAPLGLAPLVSLVVWTVHEVKLNGLRMPTPR